jgi:hypothetical protein
MTETTPPTPRYDGTAVHRIFDKERNFQGYNVPPNPNWPLSDVIAWHQSSTNTETGLNIGVTINPDGSYTVTADFLKNPLNLPNAFFLTGYLSGIQSGYIAASHRKGVLSGFGGLFL